MGGRRWFWLVLWTLVAAGMLLAPAPREWGAFGKWINAYYDHVRPVLQPAAHVALMAVGVILLMGHFQSGSLVRALLLSVTAAMTVALAFEVLQSALPVDYARQCDAEDLVPSFAGALVGGIIGTCRHLKNRNEDQ